MGAITATRRNMDKFPDHDAFSTVTGETFSGNAADYFWLSPDETLTDERGNPMILVRPVRAFLNPDGSEVEL